MSRADHPREMGKIARINVKKKFCANYVIPAYETYCKRILDESWPVTSISFDRFFTILYTVFS